MRYVLAILAALIALSCGRADAQLISCTLPSYVFKLHATTETAYTIGTPDQCSTLIFQNVSGETVTLPAPGTTFFPPGYYTKFYASGAGGLTIAPVSGATYTVNATTSVSLSQGKSIICNTDGNNWWCT